MVAIIASATQLRIVFVIKKDFIFSYLWISKIFSLFNNLTQNIDGIFTFTV